MQRIEFFNSFGVSIFRIIQHLAHSYLHVSPSSNSLDHFDLIWFGSHVLHHFAIQSKVDWVSIFSNIFLNLFKSHSWRVFWKWVRFQFFHCFPWLLLMIFQPLDVLWLDSIVFSALSHDLNVSFGWRLVVFTFRDHFLRRSVHSAILNRSIIEFSFGWNSRVN